MTLEEAIGILGTAILAVMVKSPGSEVIAMQIFHALVEEWMDGSLESVKNAKLDAFETYGSNTVQQAARVIANKVNVYGDVE